MWTVSNVPRAVLVCCHDVYCSHHLQLLIRSDQMLPSLQIGFVASFTSKLSDTVSSEIGKVGLGSSAGNALMYQLLHAQTKFAKPLSRSLLHSCFGSRHMQQSNLSCRNVPDMQSIDSAGMCCHRGPIHICAVPKCPPVLYLLCRHMAKQHI